MLNGKPLAIELFCGSFGWSAGWLEMGGMAIGFDIDHQDYHGPVPLGAHLVLQDARTLRGSQFENADVIFASPPCQKYSYMAMPFSKAKQMAAEYRSGVRSTEELNELFECCFRIQREACEASGRHIPVVVEHVRGAQAWVGASRARFGSFHLWGDVGCCGCRVIAGQMSHENAGISSRMTVGRKPDEHYFGTKGKGSWFGDYQEMKATGRGAINRQTSSRSKARKAASALIARIPLPLSRYMAQAFWPLPTGI